MAGKNATAKKQSFLAGLYLRGYNLIQVFGWSYILYAFVCHYTTPSQASLWQTVRLPVIIFQNAAILEVVHAAVGLVRSNPIITATQISSRVMIVCGALVATPDQYAASSPGLPLCMLAWSITEIVRYSYYFMSLVGHIPSVLTWLRYTLFIALYPLGITGELLCLYYAILYAKEYPQAYSYTFPNTINFAFSYLYFLVFVALLYIPVFPQLYMHMFMLRRKMLGGDKSQKKSQ